MANTGRKTVLSLQLWNKTTETPTGTIKLNVPGDPDYIAPSIDLTSCPLVGGFACPTIKFGQYNSELKINYIFSLPLSIVNGTVKAVRVILKEDGIIKDQTQYNSFIPNWFDGLFITGLSIGPSYSIELEYDSITGELLHTCSGYPPIILI